MDKKEIGQNLQVGKCLTMCPIKEAKDHEKYELSEFEMDKNTNQFRTDLAITSYSRSYANKQFDETKTRPLPVLIKTMKHILSYVIGERLNTSEKTKEIDLLLYLRGRFRSMMSDISSQHLKGPEVIELIQTMILFFIWAGARFPNDYDTDTFDPVMNREILNDMFDPLDDQYRSLYNKTKVHHPYEADFRAFNLLLYISNEKRQFMAQVYNLIPPEFMQTEPIKNVFKLRQAIILRNIPEFLKVIDSAPIQFSIMALQNVPSLYYSTFLATRKAFRDFKFEKSFFTIYLDLPYNYFDKFANCFSIHPNSSDPKRDLYLFELNAHPDESKSPILPFPLDIQQRFNKSPILEFLKLKPSSPIIASTVNVSYAVPESEVHVKPESEDDHEESENENQSNPIETEHISSQPSLNITPQPSIAKEPESPKMSPQFSDIKKNETSDENEEIEKEDEPVEDEIELPPPRLALLERQDSPIIKESEEGEEALMPFKISMKMRKIIQKPILFDFLAMIPPDLPPFCFISVLVNDSDGSPSAQFARDCFSKLKVTNSLSNLKKYIIYLEDAKVSSFSCSKSHVYISIVRKEIQGCMNSVGSILNCEDTTCYEGEEEEIPIFTFSLSDSKSSPEIVLNSLMRKCIENAVVEFQPTNLTDIVKEALELSMKIVLSPKWQRSSCNSILNLINKVNDSLADLFESELFMRFLLPFIHNEFGPDKMSQFASSIRKMKIPLIEKDESVKPRLDSSWPIFIRDNMKIKSMTPFIAPVSAKFDRQEFLNLAVGPYENLYPTEYVLQPKVEEMSLTDILHAFDCDLYE